MLVPETFVYEHKWIFLQIFRCRCEQSTVRLEMVIPLCAYCIPFVCVCFFYLLHTPSTHHFAHICAVRYWVLVLKSVHFCCCCCWFTRRQIALNVWPYAHTASNWKYCGWTQMIEWNDYKLWTKTTENIVATLPAPHIDDVFVSVSSTCGSKQFTHINKLGETDGSRIQSKQINPPFSQYYIRLSTSKLKPVSFSYFISFIYLFICSFTTTTTRLLGDRTYTILTPKMRLKQKCVSEEVKCFEHVLHMQVAYTYKYMQVDVITFSLDNSQSKTRFCHRKREIVDIMTN